MSRGRLAPSPTGELHLGGAATFLVAWLEARTKGGTLVLRIEDLDRPRVVAGAQARIQEDLRWLGVDWDEGPVRQSERLDRYEAALERLASAGLTYLCDCSRAEVERVASAPHPGEEVRYPGTCRPFGMARRDFKRPPAVRFRVPEGTTAFDDAVLGRVEEDVLARTGDFVLRRGDGVFAYQLAVVVDDAEMAIERVVRGADLLASTARQILLFRALDHTPPTYLHAPLLLGPDGTRLAKRAHGVPVADQRRDGRSPEDVIGALAHAIGLVDRDAPLSLRELAQRYDRTRLARHPVPAPRRLVAGASV